MSARKTTRPAPARKSRVPVAERLKQARRGRRGRRAAGVRRPVTLAIDVGGSHIKAALLDPDGHMTSERVRIDTPETLTPESLLDALVEVAGCARREGAGGDFDRVSVGLNGIVFRGRVFSIPVTSDPAFRDLDLAAELDARLGKPVRLLNDGMMQGLGLVSGHGVEVAITLGTGLGTALFIDGQPGPQIQFLPGPSRATVKGGDYGERERKRLGRRRWSRRVEVLIDMLRAVTNFDHLYIGGGNASRLALDLPPDVSVGDNTAALVGGVRAWEWDVRT